MKVKAYGTEGKADMCKAITELVERGRREGIEQGIERGIQGMIEMACGLGSTKEEVMHQLVDKMQLSGDEAGRYVGQYRV